jgi:anti-anti-sigma factor
MNVETTARATIIHVAADLDAMSGRWLSDSIVSAEQAEPELIVVSLARCRHCDSSSLSTLLKASIRIGPRFSTIVPRNTSCRRTFDVTGLSNRSFVFESLDVALASHGSPMR